MSPLAIRRPDRPHVQFGQAAIATPTAQGLPDVDDLWAELQEYVDVILGREPAPVEFPAYLALGGVDEHVDLLPAAVVGRGDLCEREGVVMRGSPLYKFRTGELRSFLDLSKRAAELGSRRLTQEQLMFQMREE